MEEIVFVVDESGAKGYSNNKEQYPGELGVVAGYMLPGALIEKVRAELQEVFRSFMADGKLHVTDLASDQQRKLRDEVYSFLRRHGAPWVYEAIYVHGLHHSVSRSNEISEQARKEQVSKVKVSSRPESELLHAKIFSGAVFKAIAFGMDRGLKEFKLTIVTDRVDPPIVKMFREEVDAIFSVGQEHAYEVKGYDTESKTVVSKKYTIKTTVDENWDLDLSGVQYEILIEDSPITLVSDVLANSVHYHLKKIQGTIPAIDLNCEEAISEHPLRCYLYGIPQGEIPWFTDSLYAHPNRTDGT